MSNLPNSALANPITEDDIANYLANTPDFFVRHAELLAAVQLNRPHGHRAVSLQERQAEMLRDKIKLLEQRIMEMMRNGNDNVINSQPARKPKAGADCNNANRTNRPRNIC